MNEYRTATVTSVDGTVIGYRQVGSGPGIVLVPGGMQAAQHLMTLARALSDRFTVSVVDRRGRGLSGPHGPDFGILREVEDLTAVAAATGASRIFGLSSGALGVLRAALTVPAFDRVAVYDPPLSTSGSVPTHWLPRYDRELARGQPAAALITALKGIRVDPLMSRVPRFALRLLMPLVMRSQQRVPDGDVAIAALIPTQRYDIMLIDDLADTVGDYAELRTPVLLLGGARSPGYLRAALNELQAVLPNSRRITFPGLGHSGPDEDGDPRRVSLALRAFFTET
jgi:pimeloyl-ACP methyl ester carboxylesterase